MEKVINKLKNEELLKFDDLKIVANYLLNDNATNKVVYGLEPQYNNNKKEIILNDEVNSKWFLSEYVSCLTGEKIKKIFTQDEIKLLNELKKKQYHSNNLYNMILLNAVAHEVRHANQNDILNDINNYDKYDLLFLKNLLHTKLMNNKQITTNYHDFLYNEYDADFYAIEFVNGLNKELNFDDIDYYNKYGCYKILRAYLDKTRTFMSSPVQNTDDILPSIEPLLFSMKCLENNYELLQNMINDYEGYKYYELFKYINNNEFEKNNNLYEKLKNGDNIEDLTEIKNIYLERKIK